MDLAERVKAFGFIRIEHRDKFGHIRGIYNIKNLITNAGKAIEANVMVGGAGYPTHLALGTGTTAPAVTDTTLGTETHRVAATLSRVTTSVTYDTAQIQATFTFASGYDISEAGMLNNVSGGDLIARQTFTAIPVVSGDSLIVTWKIQY